MRHLMKSIPILIAMIVPFALVSNANAAGETVAATTTIAPKGGKFYRQANVASDLKIRAEVTTPESSPTVNPLKNVKVTFPAGMTFNPNNNRTPVCPDNRLNQQSNLADPAGIVAACPRSVVGSGTAAIIIAKVNLPGALISDPVLIAFNAGRTAQGQPRLKIYGYSKFTNVGILMDGVLRGRVLDIAVPVLSNDSAVKYFELEFPGPVLNRPDIDINVRGLDPNYVQARCASSPLRTNASFELGERTYPGGQPIGPTTTVVSPETTQNCNGLAGNPRLRAVRVAGPNVVRRGRPAVFRVVVRNTGTAPARNVVVTTNRGGRARGGNIAAGGQRAIAVRVPIRARQNTRLAIRFIARAGNQRAAAVKRVRVR